MRGLSTAPVAVATLSVVALGSWWLANLALLAGSGFDAAPALASDTAAYLWLAQCACVVLIAAHLPSKLHDHSKAAFVVPLLLAVAPFWPMLMLLWQTSRIPAMVFVIAQLIVLIVGMLAYGIVIVSSRAARNRRLAPLLPGVVSLLLLFLVAWQRDLIIGAFA